MVVVKQVDVRSNMKKYFDMAYDGEPVFVPRSHNRNIVIMSEDEYNSLRAGSRLEAYSKAVSASVPGSVKGSIRLDNAGKLEVIRNLKEGWNGNGAPAISESIVEKVRVILDALPVQPEIFPTALNSIQLEFDNSRRDHLEVEIDGSDTVSFFTVLYPGSEIEESLPADNSVIVKRVMEFYG